MQVELSQSVPALLLDDPLRLAGIASACALLEGSLPEREPHSGLYGATQALFDLICMEDSEHRWVEGYIRWELGLLQAVGFQLDLTSCAVTGDVSLLCMPVWNGRAVADGAGEFGGPNAGIVACVVLPIGMITMLDCLDRPFSERRVCGVPRPPHNAVAWRIWWLAYGGLAV